MCKNTTPARDGTNFFFFAPVVEMRNEHLNLLALNSVPKFLECMRLNSDIVTNGTRKTYIKQGPQRVWKVWKKYGICFFQFPDLEKVWKFVKSFGKFKKRFGNFCLLPEKNLKTKSVLPAQALRSCCREFGRKQFECCTVFSRLFLFIVQTV